MTDPIKAKGCKCEDDNKLTQALCPLHGAPAYRATNLKERFAEKFNKNAVKLRMVGQQTGYVFPDDVNESLLDFIKQELELLAEEVYKNGYSSADAAAIIKNRIQEL